MDDELHNPSASSAVRRAYGGLEGLNRAADAVEAMMAMPGWEVVLELLNVRKVSIDKRLRAGSTPLPQADYAMWHGRLDGIAAAPEVARALVERRAKVMAEQAAKHEGAGAESSELVRS